MLRRATVIAFLVLCTAQGARSEVIGIGFPSPEAQTTAKIAGQPVSGPFKVFAQRQTMLSILKGTSPTTDGLVTDDGCLPAAVIYASDEGIVSYAISNQGVEVPSHLEGLNEGQVHIELSTADFRTHVAVLAASGQVGGGGGSRPPRGYFPWRPGTGGSSSSCSSTFCVDSEEGLKSISLTCGDGELTLSTDVGVGVAIGLDSSTIQLGPVSITESN